MRTAKRITRERLDITGRTFASTCFWVLLTDIEIGFAIDLEWIFVLIGAGIQEIQNQSVRRTWRLNLIGLPSERNDVLCCEDASERVLRQNGNECGPKG